MKKLISEESKSQLSRLLTTADYVKFAKYTPLQDENARYLNVAYDFVKHIYQQIQQELLEQQKAAEVMKQTEDKTEEKLQSDSQDKVAE